MSRTVCCGVWVCLTLFTAAALAGPGDKRFDIYWVDVEGGAATLMVTPAGESILVDTGNPGRRDPDRIVQVVTKVAGLRHIDHLVTTHYHGDHYGGAVELRAALPIKTVYDNGIWEGMPEKPDKSYFEFPAEHRVALSPGDLMPVKNAEGTAKLSVQCIGGRQKFITAPVDAGANDTICAAARTKDRDGSDNANSVVLVVNFGAFRFFDAGDLTWNRETDLVCPKNLIGKVDVYQVTHHGLDASNNPVVLRSLEPTVAIMNNGTTKGCAPEVFSNLKETKSIRAIYQVHKNLRPDGSVNNVPTEFIANQEKECQGNYIKLSVAADGGTYTVGIPANKHEATYKTRGQ